ncbi:MAG: sulfurtransferase-like selenium metabolism protein YedF [Bacteroidales bacterium]
MKTIDARGMQCPRPIIETKKALKETDDGESFDVLIDNETSLGNVCKFLDDNGCSYHRHNEKGYWRLTVSVGVTGIIDKPEDEYCSVEGTSAPPGRYVVALTSDTMGQGDEILGKKLVTSFVNLLTELENAPSAILCYNAGVKLALPGSPVVETLAELEKRGVEVILCGTCIDFFGLKGKTVVGSTGDMYLIAGKLVTASSVIRP